MSDTTAANRNNLSKEETKPLSKDWQNPHQAWFFRHVNCWNRNSYNVQFSSSYMLTNSFAIVWLQPKRLRITVPIHVHMVIRFEFIIPVSVSSIYFVLDWVKQKLGTIPQNRPPVLIWRWDFLSCIVRALEENIIHTISSCCFLRSHKNGRKKSRCQTVRVA